MTVRPGKKRRIEIRETEGPSVPISTQRGLILCVRHVRCAGSIGAFPSEDGLDRSCDNQHITGH